MITWYHSLLLVGALISSLVTSHLAIAGSSDHLLEDLLLEEREEQLIRQPPPEPRLQLVTMRSPAGETERFSAKHATTRAHRPDLPRIHIEPKSYLCLEPKRLNHEQKVEAVEVNMELEGLVAQLQAKPSPRELTAHQKVFLAQVPRCEPFLTRLMIISKLLKGYTLVSLRAQ